MVLLSVSGWLLLHQNAYIVLLPAFLTLLLAVQVEIYDRTRRFMEEQSAQVETVLTRQQLCQANDYQQLEALFSIFALLKLNHPLPSMRGWAISPDFAKQLLALIYEYQPKVVVELGSGVSTLVMGYCLQASKSSRVISLDHEEAYAKASINQVMHHQLAEVAKIIYAPLQKTLVNDQSWQWYGIDGLRSELPGKIDLLVIDGPPGHLQPLSRYPALPVLYELLSDRAIIVMDDANREDEQKIIEQWKQEFNFSVVSMPGNEKGTVILQIQK